jgi:hypothetical protein
MLSILPLLELSLLAAVLVQDGAPPAPSVASQAAETPVAEQPVAESPAPVAASGAPVGAVLIAGGTVHSQVPGAPPTVADVLVEHGRIVAIEPDLAADRVPSGAVVVDAVGRHVLPGLIDGLVNFDPDHDLLYLAAGVTLVRDVGNDSSRILELRDPAGRDRAPGPVVLTAGVVFDGVPPSTPEAIVLKDVHAAEVAVPRVAPGIDFVAVQAGLSPEVWQRVVELAHESGLEVWGPAPRGASAGQAAAGGQDGIFYLDSFLPKDVEWRIVHPLAFKRDVAVVAEAGASVVPLLGGTAYRLREPRAGEDLLELLAPEYSAWWLEERERRGDQIRAIGSESYVKYGRTTMEKQLALVAALVEAGVRIVPGSGAPHPWLGPGRALHDELLLMQEAGLAADEVLALATRHAAEAVGESELRGTLEPGKVADILVVDGDPRDDLRILRRPAGVCLRGRWVSRAEIDAKLESLRERQAVAYEMAAAVPVVPEPELPDGEVLAEGELITRARGLVVSAERYAVVDRGEGAIAYVGRVITPRSGDLDDMDLSIVQEQVEGELTAFEVQVRRDGRLWLLRGTWTAGQLRVERRLDGVAIDMQQFSVRPSVVQVGSATALLPLSRQGVDGQFHALEVEEAMTPLLVEWMVRPPQEGDTEENVYAVQTAAGELFGWQLAADGTIAAWETRLAGAVSLARPPEAESEASPEDANASLEGARPAEASAGPEDVGAAEPASTDSADR